MSASKSWSWVPVGILALLSVLFIIVALLSLLAGDDAGMRVVCAICGLLSLGLLGLAGWGASCIAREQRYIARALQAARGLLQKEAAP